MTENITGTPPQEGPPPQQGGPEQGGWNTENLKDYRKLRRTRLDRKVAGVAGGLGRHLDVDPTILRVLFVVLAFFGGAGLLLYGVLWLLVPEEGSEEVVISTSESTRNGLLIGAAVLAGLLALGDTWTGFGFPWPLAIVALVVAVVLLTRDGNRSGPTPPYAGPVPPPPAGAAPPYAGSVPPPHAGATAPMPAFQQGPPRTTPPWYPPVPPVPPVPPRPRRRGPLLFGITLALIALALGVLGLFDASGTEVVDAAYPALALGVVGAMLVLGAFWGRPGGLIALGLVLSVVLAAFSIGNPSFEGDRDVRIEPRTAADLQDGYDVPAGRIVLDLSNIDDVGSLDGRSIDLEANAGEIVVVVPDNVAVRFDASVAYGGTIETPIGNRDGWSSALSGRFGDDDADAVIDLEMDLQFGRIAVNQR